MKNNALATVPTRYRNKSSKLSLWLCISYTPHSAVLQPGSLLYQPYKACVVPRSSGAHVMLHSVSKLVHAWTIRQKEMAAGNTDVYRKK